MERVKHRDLTGKVCALGSYCGGRSLAQPAAKRLMWQQLGVLSLSAPHSAAHPMALVTKEVAAARITPCLLSNVLTSSTALVSPEWQQGGPTGRALPDP